MRPLPKDPELIWNDTFTCLLIGGNQTLKDRKYDLWHPFDTEDHFQSLAACLIVAIANEKNRKRRQQRVEMILKLIDIEGVMTKELLRGKRVLRSIRVEVANYDGPADEFMEYLGSLLDIAKNIIRRTNS